MKTESEILEGIRNDEFTFFYQPKISFITGKVIGAEALIRWVKPDGALVLPADFIPVAESTRLITQITRHMFPKLIQDMMVLREVEPLSVAFNASAKDFEDETLTHTILNELAVSQIPAKSLQVELTETITLQSDPTVKKHIQPLYDAGVGLVMDDFGKGYSSIDTLARWPFTAIKLDQGLIRGMLVAEKNMTIIESAIRMAHELGIAVVAEGVETDDQYQHLLEAGCTKVQGFWISQALPLDQFIAFVQRDMRWSGLPIGLIHMAIIDHVQWRKHIVSELIRVAALPPDSEQRRYINAPPLSCRECRLGRWYYGTGQSFSDRASFRAVEAPHNELHEIGKKLIHMVTHGARLAELTPYLRDLSDASMEVMRHLQSLENEGLIDMHGADGTWITSASAPHQRARKL